MDVVWRLSDRQALANLLLVFKVLPLLKRWQKEYVSVLRLPISHSDVLA